MACQFEKNTLVYQKKRLVNLGLNHHEKAQDQHLILPISIFSQHSPKNCDFRVHHPIIERYGQIHIIILVPLLKKPQC
jgi:hypothetical protein